MKCFFIILSIIHLHTAVLAQEKKVTKAKFVLGLAGPELLHAGLIYRLSNSNQLGLTAGAGPSLGMIWSAISAEHRWYIGKNSERTDQKIWFFRQGSTYFPSETTPSQRFTFNLSVGKDIPFKNIRNGFTIDLGVFYLADSERSSIILIRSLDLWPALRFQFYFSL